MIMVKNMRSRVKAIPAETYSIQWKTNAPVNNDTTAATLRHVSRMLSPRLCTFDGSICAKVFDKNASSNEIVRPNRME